MSKVFGILLVGLVLAIGSASSPSIAGNWNQNETGFTLYDTWDIPTDAKPNLRTLEVYLRKHLNDPTSRGRGKYEIKGSENPYEFKSKKKSNAFLTKQMNTTAVLSYLYWDDGYILYDEITSKKRLGKIFENETKYRSNSVGKSLVSYVLGHAICEGYIKSLDVVINDWPLIEKTLYHNQKLINLVNMAAGDQEHVHDRNGLVKTGRWYNNESIKSFANRELKNSTPLKTVGRPQYHYNGLLTNVVMNYVIHKAGSQFQSLLDAVFRKKAKIRNSVFFARNRNGSSRIYSPDLKKSIVVDYPPNSSGPGWYMFYASRHDYLRIAKAILDDWNNDTCVGKYLKEVYERRIPKNKGPYKKTSTWSATKSYGGQFHFDFLGMENQDILGMDGYGGQSIVIDLVNARIAVVNAVHRDYDWYGLVHQVVKNGRIKGEETLGTLFLGPTDMARESEEKKLVGISPTKRTTKYDRTKAGMETRFKCLIDYAVANDITDLPENQEIESLIANLEGNDYYRSHRQIVKAGISKKAVDANKAPLIRLVNFEGTNEEYCAKPVL